MATRTTIGPVNAAVACLVALLVGYTGGCVVVDASREGGAPGAESVRVDLLVVAVDGDRFEGTTDARWLRSFLSNVPRDVDIQRSETDDLLGEAKRRLRSAPGFEFMRSPRVVIEAGKRATFSETMGAGSELKITVRPRPVGRGLYEVSPEVEFLHSEARGDGVISGVTYRAPALRYGSVPMTVREGEAGAVRMRREIGAPVRPSDLQVFVFASVTASE